MTDHHKGAPHRPPGSRWWCNTATRYQSGRCAKCHNGTPFGESFCRACQSREWRFSTKRWQS